MIYSLFAVNDSGDVFFEKHWRNIVPKSICDYFIDLKSNSPFDVPPIIKAHQFYLFNIHRSNFYLIATCPSNVLYILILNLLEQIFDILKEYFPNINDVIFKENVVVIYEILSEMINGGLPVTTDIIVLKDRIKSPNIFRNLANSVTGNSNICDTISNSELNNVPWRKTDLRFANNDTFFDVNEYLNVIIDKNGSCIFSEVIGEINCYTQLSGMPILNLKFLNPKIFDDIHFHRCVKVLKWEKEKIVSFIPPHGDFSLLNYKISSQNVIPFPVYIKHNINYESNNWGNLDISVDPSKSCFILEGVKLELALPNVCTCFLETNQGHFTFDSVKKILIWDIGRLDNTKIINIHGTISFLSIMPTVEASNSNNNSKFENLNPEIKMKFLIHQLSISGMKITKVYLTGESYKPFKGVKYVTQADHFCVRT